MSSEIVTVPPTPGPPNPHPPEGGAVLLRRYARGGDEDAFDELVRRHVDLVYSAALRQCAGHRALAEDITQAVFTTLARQAARLTGHPALAGWLLTTTRRIALTTLRAERRRRRREDATLSMETPPGTPHPPSQELDWTRLGPVLDAVLHELNERDRAAVVLRFFQARPFAEIGSELGLTANAARMRVDRALDRLRVRLARRGIASTSAALAASLGANAVHAAPAGLSAAVAAASLASAPIVALPAAAAWITPMLTLKTKVLLAGLAIALVAVPLGWQHASLDRLRRELADERAAREALAESEAAAHQDAERAAGEIRQLRSGQTELLRLRGEVGPLREQVRALARTVGSVPPASRSPVPAPATEPEDHGPADRGSGTAEHAASSLIWAVGQGRMDRLAELLELPSSVATEDAPRHFAFFANQLRNVFQGREFNGWKMDLRGTTNEDVVRLQYGYRDLGTGKDDTFGFLVHRLDSGWKVMVEGAVPEGF